jgi:hypothetical protein
MSSLDFDFPIDTDYINVDEKDDATRMPIIFSVTMNLIEIRSGKELSYDSKNKTREFNIEKYRSGTLDYW